MGLLLFTLVPATAQAENAKSSVAPLEDAKRSVAPSEDAKPPRPKKLEASEVEDVPPRLEIKSMYVNKSEKPELKKEENNLAKGRAVEPQAVNCNETPHTSITSVGAVDVRVITSKTDYKAALNNINKGNASLILQVNGVPMGADAKLFSVEERNDVVQLLWSIKPGKRATNYGLYCIGTVV